MTGRSPLLTALLGLLLTQAIFAQDQTAEDLNRIVPDTAEYETLAASAAKKVEDIVETARDVINSVLPSDQFDDKDAAASREFDKLYPPVKSSGPVLPDPPVQPPPSATKPDEVEPAVTDLEVAEPTEMKKPGRKVKSYKISGNDVQLEDQQAHTRVKRDHVGSGVPDEFEFTLEALAPFETADPAFQIGDVIEYRLTIHASNVETDVQVEIFSELDGGPFFMISNVRVGDVGGNFRTFVTDEVVIRYFSKFNDGRWDYATVDMGDILNDATDATTVTENQIQLLFDVQALPRASGLVVDNLYRVSVGAMYQGETYVTVAQDDLKYAEYTEQTPAEATFSITGPSELNLGVTGVWTIEAAIYDLYSDLSLDVLAPLHNPGIMTIDKISVLSVGENYEHSSVAFDDGGNFTRSTYENFGDYGSLELGTIVNKGYHSGDSDLAKNTITFEVAVTMLDHVINESSPYTIGFTIWKKDQDSVEIMWSAQEELTAVNESLSALSSSPVFYWGPSADTVVVGGRFSVLLNMSVPTATSAKYVLEASVPVNATIAVMDIENVRLSRIGFNLAHVSTWVEENPITYTTESTDPNSDAIDFISWDLGIITNTGQRTGTDDHVLQFEVTIRVRDESTDFYDEGDSMFVSLGMKHAEDYYWVGRTSVIHTEVDIEYNGDQVPEFSFVNVMGYDARIFPESAAVFDLDMIVPAGVDYTPFTMEISTTNFSDDACKLKIVSMEIIHQGKALFLEDIGVANLTYFTEELDPMNETINSVGILEIGRVTSLRDENYGRYSFEDSTIRIRTVVVARGDTDHVDQDVYWTETTVNFHDSYIYAARAGVTYNDTLPDLYDQSGDAYVWQPTMTWAIKEGGSNEVAKGTAVFYNVTFGIPYRTASDLKVQMTSSTNEIQICRLRHLSSGSAIVEYDPPTYVGDILNSTSGARNDTAYNYKPMVTSVDYGYYVGDVRDSYVTYEAIVMLNALANVGTNYTYAAEMKMANGALTTPFTPALSTIDVPAAVTTLPEVYIGKLTNNTDTINFGGSEIYYMDIYVPPGTQHHMVVNIFAPWNATFYGDYELLSVDIASVGINIVCYDHTMTTKSVTQSSDNNSTMNNLGIIDLGYVPSVNLEDSTIETEDNKIRLLAHVAMSSNSTLAAGDVIPVAGTIDMDDEHLWVGYVETTVVSSSDTSNDLISGNVTLEIFATSDNIYNVGEIQDYEGVLIIPAGDAYADFTINLISEVDNDESRFKIYDVEVLKAGQHMQELLLDYEIVPVLNPYGVEHRQNIDFKFARNSDRSGRSNYVNSVNSSVRGESENELLFRFKMQMLDTLELEDGYEFNMTTSVDAARGNLAVGFGDIGITVEGAPEDNAVLIWDVNLVEAPTQILQDSVLTFDLDIYLEDPPTSKRFPSEVVINYRLPGYSRLEQVYNKTGIIDSQFDEPSAIDQFGLKFTWSKIRWENRNSLEFDVTVDPDFTLEPGLGTRTVSIPIDVSYRRENRSDPGNFDDWFTEMRTLTFTLTIPEKYDELGMDSGDIKDCQITASSDDGANLPKFARPSQAGWSTALGRGPPLYQNEYIQVDFADEVKFTGVTIYPFDHVANTDRVTSFKVQYSRRGIRWNYALDNSLEPKTFTITWPAGTNSSTSAFVVFDKSAFVARHIRILPQSNAQSTYASRLRFELHGYAWPAGSTLSSYTCPSPASTAGMRNYVDRQILAVSGTEELYVCTIGAPGQMPYCSGTHDFGHSWFALDNNVLNVLGFDNATATLYGLARDQKSCLRSTDNGHSWKAIDCSRFDSVDGSADYTASVEVPFPLGSTDPVDLFNTYGTQIDASHTWTVSEKALHAYPGSADDFSSSFDDNANHAAYWGDKPWNGP